MSDFMTLVIAVGQRLKACDLVCLNEDGEVDLAYPNAPHFLGCLPPATRFWDSGRRMDVPPVYPEPPR